VTTDAPSTEILDRARQLVADAEATSRTDRKVAAELAAEAAALIEPHAEATSEARRIHLDALVQRGECLARIGQMEEGVAVLEQAAALLPRNQRDPDAVRILRTLGNALSFHGRTQDAIDRLREATEAAPPGEADEELREARFALVEALTFGGRHEEAWEAAQAMLAEPDLEAWPQHAVRLRKLGADALMALGQPQHAMRLLDEALARGTEAQDDVALAGIQSSRGRLLRELGDDAGALEAYGRALQKFRDLGHHSGAAATLMNTALVHIDMEDFEAAERSARESLDLVRERKAIRLESAALRILAAALQRRGNLEEAVETIERSLELAREFGSYAEEVAALVRLGKILIDLERGDDALATLESALALATERQDAAHVAFSLEALARVHASRGEQTQALARLDEGFSAAEPLDQTELTRKLHETASQIYRTFGDHHGALLHVDQAHQIEVARLLRRAEGQVDRLRYERELDAARFQAELAEERERRRSAEAIRMLSARLLTAQEEEQRRIGRDLHDDLGQRLALLSIELQQAAQAATEADSPLGPRLQAATESAQAIAGEVSRLSHQLHPAQLEHLGLVSALRGLCREVAEKTDLEVELVADPTLPELRAPTALGLYRIVQEALRNVVRHSGADAAEVTVDLRDGSIALGVRDSGAGFDPERISSGRGLGLVSMRERASLLGGRLEIDSSPGEGTTVRVFVPARADDR
jgi:signal transduction histidine kinase